MVHLYIPEEGFLSMNAWKSLFLSLVLASILSVGFSYVLSPQFTAPSSDGSVSQSPLLYIIITIIILLAGAVFHFFLRPSEGKSFHFWLFICVAFSGLMVGGIIHELVHVVLISHPTQFRVHFGDPSAILSTCCLLPGEYAYEEVAYLLQSLVTAGWILSFRNYFIRGRHSPPIQEEGISKKVQNPVPFESRPSLVDESEDPEWFAARKESDALLKDRDKGFDEDSMNEPEDLRRLRVPKRE